VGSIQHSCDPTDTTIQISIRTRSICQINLPACSIKLRYPTCQAGVTCYTQSQQTRRSLATGMTGLRTTIDNGGCGSLSLQKSFYSESRFPRAKIHPGQPLKFQTKITRVVNGSEGNHQPPALLPTPAFTALFFAAQLLLSNHPRARIWKSTTSPSSLSTLELTIALQVLCTNTAASTNRC
jgi:hypothetical protein